MSLKKKSTCENTTMTSSNTGSSLRQMEMAWGLLKRPTRFKSKGKAPCWRLHFPGCRELTDGVLITCPFLGFQPGFFDSSLTRLWCKESPRSSKKVTRKHGLEARRQGTVYEGNQIKKEASRMFSWLSGPTGSITYSNSPDAWHGSIHGLKCTLEKIQTVMGIEHPTT